MYIDANPTKGRAPKQSSHPGMQKTLLPSLFLLGRISSLILLLFNPVFLVNSPVETNCHVKERSGGTGLLPTCEYNLPCKDFSQGRKVQYFW